MQSISGIGVYTFANFFIDDTRAVRAPAFHDSYNTPKL